MVIVLFLAGIRNKERGVELQRFPDINLLRGIVIHSEVAVERKLCLFFMSVGTTTEVIRGNIYYEDDGGIVTIWNDSEELVRVLGNNERPTRIRAGIHITVMLTIFVL